MIVKPAFHLLNDLSHTRRMLLKFIDLCDPDITCHFYSCLNKITDKTELCWQCLLLNTMPSYESASTKLLLTWKKLRTLTR